MSKGPDHAAIRIEIAAGAARWIVEDGLDYARAKRRAAQSVLGDRGQSRGLLPDNALIESEVRRYLQTFAGATHPALLAALRQLAAQWLKRLAPFNPHVVGSVLNGTATGHSDLHLHLFTDDVKEVEMYLLNEGIDFDAGSGGENEDNGGAPEETLSFVTRSAPGTGLPPRVGIVLAVHRADAIRVAPRFRSSDESIHAIAASGRANAAQFQELLRAGSS